MIRLIVFGVILLHHHFASADGASAEHRIEIGAASADTYSDEVATGAALSYSNSTLSKHGIFEIYYFNTHATVNDESITNCTADCFVGDIDLQQLEASWGYRGDFYKSFSPEIRMAYGIRKANYLDQNDQTETEEFAWQAMYFGMNYKLNRQLSMRASAIATTQEKFEKKAGFELTLHAQLNRRWGLSLRAHQLGIEKSVQLLLGADLGR